MRAYSKGIEEPEFCFTATPYWRGIQPEKLADRILIGRKTGLRQDIDNVQGWGVGAPGKKACVAHDTVHVLSLYS